MIRIIGIDPGLNKTGWAVVDKVGFEAIYVASGIIKTSTAQTLPSRLLSLHTELNAVILDLKPILGAIENTYINKNFGSSLDLSHARAALILGMAQNNLDISEYQAKTIKKTGNKVVANINITSLEIDGLLEIKERATKYYDVNGGFADATNLRLSVKDSYNKSVGDKFTFPKGFAIPLEIHFEKVPESNGITLLKLTIFKNSVKIIKFRDIKIQ